MTPIVLVPGQLCTAEVFGPQIAALWPQGPVTVASTLTGNTMAEIASNILANAPPRFALAGISMGGFLCFELWRQAPERIMKLALLSTSARPATPERAAQHQTYLARAQSLGLAEVLAQAKGSSLHPARRDDPVVRGTNRRMALTVGLDALARQTNAIISRPDSRLGLANISVSTLVLVGDSDPLTTPAEAEEMAAAVPEARLVIVPECGHSATLEQPDAVSRALIDWIAD